MFSKLKCHQHFTDKNNMQLPGLELSITNHQVYILCSCAFIFIFYFFVRLSTPVLTLLPDSQQYVFVNVLFFFLFVLIMYVLNDRHPHMSWLCNKVFPISALILPNASLASTRLTVKNSAPDGRANYSKKQKKKRYFYACGFSEHWWQVRGWRMENNCSKNNEKAVAVCFVRFFFSIASGQLNSLRNASVEVVSECSLQPLCTSVVSFQH